MSRSLCLQCGSLKAGAFNPCGSCGEAPVGLEVSARLTTHYLEEDELKKIGRAVKVLNEKGLSGEGKRHAFMHFVSRKWPKVWDYDIEQVSPKLAKVADRAYRNHLVNLPGQQREHLASRIRQNKSWKEASVASMQKEEDKWNAEVNSVLQRSINLAYRIIDLKVEGGEGAKLQQFKFGFKRLFSDFDYRPLISQADSLLEDAKEHKREIVRFSKPVKNGWSGRTRRRMQYLGGTSIRLIEMAEACLKIFRHKAGVELITDVELEQTKQEFDLSYKHFQQLVGAVSNYKELPKH